MTLRSVDFWCFVAGLGSICHLHRVYVESGMGTLLRKEQVSRALGGRSRPPLGCPIWAGAGRKKVRRAILDGSALLPPTQPGSHPLCACKGISSHSGTFHPLLVLEAFFL